MRAPTWHFPYSFFKNDLNFIPTLDSSKSTSFLWDTDSIWSLARTTERMNQLQKQLRPQYLSKITTIAEVLLNKKVPQKCCQSARAGWRAPNVESASHPNASELHLLKENALKKAFLKKSYEKAWKKRQKSQKMFIFEIIKNP